MLGRYTPLYALAFDYVPGINLFRRPVDGAFVFVAVLAILVGHLLADYVREGRRACHSGVSPSLPLGRSAIVAWAMVFSEDRITDGTRCAPRLKAAPIALPVIVALAGRARPARALWQPAASRLAGGRTRLVERCLEPERRTSRLLLGSATAGGEEAAALAVLEREIDARRKKAIGRASRSLASAALGRTSP